jgi:hypothetical protein
MLRHSLGDTRSGRPPSAVDGRRNQSVGGAVVGSQLGRLAGKMAHFAGGALLRSFPGYLKGRSTAQICDLE